MKSGILGYGEIGKAISKVCKEAGDEVLARDVDRDEFDGKIDVIHVCIPFQGTDFVNTVNSAVEDHDVDLVIIHSTVPVGTTKMVKNAVHSPCRGVHPNLYEGIKTFIKYVGSDNEELTKKTKKVLTHYGLKHQVFEGSRTTELNKLLDTTYYGICIEAHRYFKSICDHYDVDFDSVVEFNKTYNEGYLKLGKENVVRPALYAPEGEIGGHCVIPNAKLLQEQFPTQFIDTIFFANQRQQEESQLRRVYDRMFAPRPSKKQSPERIEVRS